MPIHDKVVTLYKKLGYIPDIYRFLKVDQAGAKRYNISRKERLRAWQNGFDSKHWVWMSLGEKDCETYINTIQAIRTIPFLNEPYSGVFDDKVAFHIASEPLFEYLPELFGTVHNGVFVSQSEESGMEKLDDILTNHKKAIMKPICGGSGQGVHTIEKNEQGYIIDHRPAKYEELKELITKSDDLMVTELIEQANYSSGIFPRSINTIRVNTIVDPETQQPHIVRATHRFGNSQSEPTDNWSRGGICAPIDVDEGVLKTAIDPNNGRTVKQIEKHPESGSKIKGVRIPDWDKVCEVIKSFAERHRRAPYVGWDVVVSDTKPVIIEANANPAIYLPQMERGLLEEDVAVRFFNSIE